MLKKSGTVKTVLTVPLTTPLAKDRERSLLRSLYSSGDPDDRLNLEKSCVLTTGNRGVVSGTDSTVLTFIILLIIPATNATSERSFSALKRIKSYLRSTMTPQPPNVALLPSRFN